MEKQMITTFSDLIKNKAFFIPDYQRAYSWTEKEIAQFITDIVEHAGKTTRYYLGHYILEDDETGRLAIVDGQQRLTTVAIFLAVCQFLSNSSTPRPSICLNVVEYDNDQFKNILLPSNLACFLVKQEGRTRERTSSMERVVRAIETFFESFSTDKNQAKPALLSTENIDTYLNVIFKAAVSLGVYKDKAVAAQIFELHNTRGVLLTETEKVKALLMKYVYLNSVDGNRNIDDIQKAFAKVYEMEERAAEASFRGDMSLDDILGHHLRAIDDGMDKDSFTEPQNVEGEYGCLAYVKNKLKEFEGDKQSGVQYSKALAREFAKSMVFIGETMVVQDKKEPLIGDVVLLDQRRSMIFLLRYFRALPKDQIADQVLLRRWESFLFLWDWHDAFYNMKSVQKDSFPNIFQEIASAPTKVGALLLEYYSGSVNFAAWPFLITRANENGENISKTGLEEVFRGYIATQKENLLHTAYNWKHWHSRYKYWLYKYEIEFKENESASNQTDQFRHSLRKMFKENAITLDHIVPHELGWPELSVTGEQNSDITQWKDDHDRKQAEENWEKILKNINGIGNLVILSHSVNASLKNIAPFKRAASYKEWELKSVSYEEVAKWTPPTEWGNDNNAPWHARIEARGERLISWMVDYFTNETTWIGVE
jgi:hypothetical protein